MVSLNSYVDSFDFPKDLRTVSDLLHKAHTDISFWGGRIFSVGGYTGSASLTALGDRIRAFSGFVLNIDKLTPAERILGIEIGERLRVLYELNDTQIKTHNIFTRFLFALRNIFSGHMETERFDTVKNFFSSFNIEQFSQNFGTINRKDDLEHPAWAGFSGYRIIAKEESIQQLIRV